MEEWNGRWGSVDVSYDSSENSVIIKKLVDVSSGLGVYDSNPNNYFTVEPNKNYSISFWARANRNNVHLGYNYFMSKTGSSNLSLGGGPYVSSEWRKYTITTNSNSSSDKYSLMLALALLLLGKGTGLR